MAQRPAHQRHRVAVTSNRQAPRAARARPGRNIAQGLGMEESGPRRTAKSTLAAPRHRARSRHLVGIAGRWPAIMKGNAPFGRFLDHIEAQDQNNITTIRGIHNPTSPRRRPRRALYRAQARPSGRDTQSNNRHRHRRQQRGRSLDLTSDTTTPAARAAQWQHTTSKDFDRQLEHRFSEQEPQCTRETHVHTKPTQNYSQTSSGKRTRSKIATTAARQHHGIVSPNRNQKKAGRCSRIDRLQIGAQSASGDPRPCGLN